MRLHLVLLPLEGEEQSAVARALDGHHLVRVRVRVRVRARARARARARVGVRARVRVGVGAASPGKGPRTYLVLTEQGVLSKY